MGFFDSLLGKKSSDSRSSAKLSEKDILRLERLLGSKLSQNLDREEAINTLSKDGSARAAAALLKRFDWILDPSIMDQDEKEACVRGIVATGEAALEPLREYCKKAESLTWPFRVLRAVVPVERLEQELLALLDQYDNEYVRNPEPKVQLINALAEHASEDVRIAIEPFLADASEPVRFTTVGTTFAINFPDSVGGLVAALEVEESLRVKNRIAQGLAERRWEIPVDMRPVCGKSLPPGYELRGAIVEAR